MKKVLSLVVGVSIGVSIFLGFKWYAYVTNTVTPYDEMGIQLNGIVPQSLNDWGCAKLMATFTEALPPLGCAGPDGRWRADLKRG